LNQLTIREKQLPDNLQDLSKFVLIGSEKLVAIRAEIRAITKAKLAEEVYQQKLEEQRVLSNLILDASEKIGELTAKIPKAPGIRPNQTSSPRGNEVETKEQVIRKMGFSKKQAHQFETLAKNKDLVEQEKAQAAEEGRPASRARVIELAQERKKREEETATRDENYSLYLDHCHKVANHFNSVIHDAATLPTDEKHLSAWMELVPEPERIKEYIRLIDQSIPDLLSIKNFLERRLKDGKS
jgi:hypothetical protein